MQKLWSGIWTILKVGECKNSYITSIFINNKSVDYPKDITNIFNSFFANVGDSTERIPRGSQSRSFHPGAKHSGLICSIPVTSREI